MTRPDHQSETESSESADPLSATGMFLNAFRIDSELHEGEPEVFTDAPYSDGLRPAPPRHSEVDRPPLGGNTPLQSSEFTRLFQSIQAPSASANPEFQRAVTPGPGEFTRIFVPPPLTPLEMPRTEVEFRPSGEQNPKLGRGFSSPGASDSATGEGDFTQLFRSASRSREPSEDYRAFTQPATANPGNAASHLPSSFTQIFQELPSTQSPEKPLGVSGPAGFSPTSSSSDSASSDFANCFQSAPSTDLSASASASPFPDNLSRSPLPGMGELQPLARFAEAGMPPDSPRRVQSATEMFLDVASNSRPQLRIRPPMVDALAAPPAFTPPTLASGHSPLQSGSLTELINMLSPVAPQPTPGSWSHPSPPRVDQPMPAANAGMGEFTTIISGENIKAGWVHSATPRAHSPSEVETSLARVPGAALPILPAPKFATPPITIPKPPSAAATPMSKLQEMLPVLLVLNAVLMLVLIMVTIFALRHR